MFDIETIQIKIKKLETLFILILESELGSPMMLRHLRIPRKSACQKLMMISIVHGLLHASKTLTKRDLFYLQKRLFVHQDSSDARLEWLAHQLKCPRSELRVVAAARGLIVGDLSWYEKGQYLRIIDFGTSGHLIPPSLSLFVSHIDTGGLQAVLYVEKETVFHQLSQAGLTRDYPIALITGKGFADLGTRELISALSKKLRIIGLVDADPHGVGILASLLGTLARDDPSLVASNIEWMGIKPSDIVAMAHRLEPAQFMRLQPADITCCRALLSKKNLPAEWNHELELMMQLDLKAEIEILDSISPNYLATAIVPHFLKSTGIPATISIIQILWVDADAPDDLQSGTNYNTPKKYLASVFAMINPSASNYIYCRASSTNPLVAEGNPGEALTIGGSLWLIGNNLDGSPTAIKAVKGFFMQISYFVVFENLQLQDGSYGIFKTSDTAVFSQRINFTRCHFQTSTTDSGGILSLRGVSDVLIDQCIFKSNYGSFPEINTSSTTYGTFEIQNTNFSSFVGTPTTAALVAEATINLRMQNCHFTDYQSNGIQSDTGTSLLYIYYSSFTNFQYSPLSIMTADLDELRISDTTFDNFSAVIISNSPTNILNSVFKDFLPPYNAVLLYSDVMIDNSHFLHCNVKIFDANVAAISHSSFDGGVDVGCVDIVRSNLEMYNCTFDTCADVDAGPDGGAFSVVALGAAVSTSVTDVRMKNCWAPGLGGAVRYIVDDPLSTLSMEHIVVRNTVASSGGAIHILTPGAVNLTSIVTYNCTANTTGGSLYINATGPQGAVRLTDVSIDLATAPLAGGIWLFSDATVEIDGLAISNATATDSAGGGMVVNAVNSGINLNNSTFEACLAQKEGGGFLAFAHNHFYANDVAFTDCSAGLGGGASIHIAVPSAKYYDISIQNATCTHATAITGEGGCLLLDPAVGFELIGLTADNCSASENGGTLAVNNSQRCLLSGITISHSYSSLLGGAISLSNSSMVDFTDGRFHDCEAVLGGGLYFSYAPVFFESSLSFDGMEFTDCHAKDKGGAMSVETDVQVSLANFYFSSCTAVTNGGALHVLSAGQIVGYNITSIDSSSNIRNVGIKLETTVGDILLDNVTALSGTDLQIPGGIHLNTAYDAILTRITVRDSITNYVPTVGLAPAGCLTVFADHITMNSSSFSHCSSAGGAGAVHLFAQYDTYLFDIDILGANGATAGCLAVYQSSDSFDATNLNISNCTGMTGGGLLVNSAASVRISTSHFSHSTSPSGGCAFISTVATALPSDAIRLEEVYFTNCVSTQGGALLAISPLGGLLAQKVVTTAASAIQGGAFYLTSVPVVDIQSCQFTHCTADEGGALFFAGASQFSVAGGAFISCGATLSGGAISGNLSSTVSTAVTLSDSEYSGCTAGGNGGAIALNQISPSALLQHYVITSGNFIHDAVASSGAGLYLGMGSGDVQLNFTDTASTFLQNNATRQTSSSGGALCIHGALASLTLRQTNITLNNAANSGGGLYLETSVVAVLDMAQFRCNNASTGAQTFLQGSTPAYTDLGVVFSTDCEPPPVTTITAPPLLTTTATASLSTTTTTPATTTTTTTSLLPSTTISSAFTSTTTPVIDLCPNEPSLTQPSSCGCYPPAYCHDCTIFPNATNCPPLTFPGTQNTSHPTVVTFPPTTPGIIIEVTLPHNATMEFNFSWGSIREVNRSSMMVKGIDVGLTNWTRNILVDPAILTAKLSTTILPHGPFHYPFNVTLTIIFIRNPEQVNISDFSTSSLKLSLEIDGNWGFASPENELHVDFSFTGPFAPNDCGDTFKKKTTSSDMIQYDIYSNKSTTFRINFLRYCFADTVKSPIQVRNPHVQGHVASFLLVYPSFSGSLFYDPSFALLLGANSNGCNDLFSWILPASFLLGALVISILICIIGSLPFSQRFMKGEEGHRIHKLRAATALHIKSQQV